MNYLELCQEVRRRTGVAGSGPSSVLNQVGIMEKIVSWVAEAYADVQAAQTRYSFLWTRTTPLISANQRVYTPTQMGAPNGIREVTDFRVGGVAVTYVDWDTWIDRFDNRADTGQPVAFTIAPNGDVYLFPTPAVDYAGQLTFYRASDQFAGDISVPNIPDPAHHYVIVWRAVMLFALDQEDNALYSRAEQQYFDRLLRLDQAYLPRIKV